MDLEEREKLLKEISDWPWEGCKANNGKCECGLVWHNDGNHIVATANSDFDTKPAELAATDARFIASAPEFEAKAIEELKKLQNGAQFRRAEMLLDDYNELAGQHASLLEKNKVMREALENIMNNNISTTGKGWESSFSEVAEEALKRVAEI